MSTAKVSPQSTDVFAIDVEGVTFVSVEHIKSAIQTLRAELLEEMAMLTHFNRGKPDGYDVLRARLKRQRAALAYAVDHLVNDPGLPRLR